MMFLRSTVLALTALSFSAVAQDDPHALRRRQLGGKKGRGSGGKKCFAPGDFLQDEENPCFGEKPLLPRVDCTTIVNAPPRDPDSDYQGIGPQTGIDVTDGAPTGGIDASGIDLFDTPLYESESHCNVNMHWHLGAEHRSEGEYDENGSGPSDYHEEDVGSAGNQCNFYAGLDRMSKKPYNWESCIDMTVGQTYEIHWVYSTQGACGTKWQYQTPFYDGVFCRLAANGVNLTPQVVASNVGVFAQVFTIVNDEDYYYPDLFEGPWIDKRTGKGTDVALYSGSTTGAFHTNEQCSPYTWITWQVDRKCHLISASSWDKMCAEMECQADDMRGNILAVSTRRVATTALTADNVQDLPDDYRE
ncbi:MAG: hypothetical protein SGILL_003482 [Bacillariaceae sp.]